MVSHPPTPRAGYTLPVFACAAAIAALRRLNEPTATLEAVSVDLINPQETVAIGIEQVAPLDSTSALAISRSDPGDNLDLTRHTPVWAWVREQWVNEATDRVHITGGEGIGQQIHNDGQAAIYHYAKELLRHNLSHWLLPDQAISVTIILPEGRSLAERTSNAAFGVVDGLSLLGTSGIAEPLSAPGQLDAFRTQLRHQSQGKDTLVFCVGENGLNLAQRMGIASDYLIKTANWIGPMLVEAGLLGIQSLLLFGYHGKLLKLAGGIFHTHHYVADGRQEILSSACVRAGLPLADIQAVLESSTAEDALNHLRALSAAGDVHWVEQVYSHVLAAVDERSHDYIYRHSQQRVFVGTLVFDRQRNIIMGSPNSNVILSQVC